MRVHKSVYCLADAVTMTSSPLVNPYKTINPSASLSVSLSLLSYFQNLSFPVIYFTPTVNYIFFSGCVTVTLFTGSGFHQQIFADTASKQEWEVTHSYARTHTRTHRGKSQINLTSTSPLTSRVDYLEDPAFSKHRAHKSQYKPSTIPTHTHRVYLLTQ